MSTLDDIIVNTKSVAENIGKKQEYVRNKMLSPIKTIVRLQRGVNYPFLTIFPDKTDLKVSCLTFKGRIQTQTEAFRPSLF